MIVLNIVCILYLIVINLIGLLMMGIDKQKSRKHRRRISERVLFIVSIIGGSVGTMVGMYLFRHKTRHGKFVIGLPVIIALQIIVGVLILQKLQETHFASMIWM